MIFLVIAILVFLPCKGVSQLVGYVQGTEDIPLIEGAQAFEDEPTIFDTLEGKVVLSKIETSLDRAAVKKFYEKILPNLGWHNVSPNKYQRRQQFLEIKTKSMKKMTLVTFELTEFL